MNSERILIIEDDPGIGSSLVQILKMFGKETSLFNTGQAALDAVKQNDFDLVLCDVNLPDISGYDIVQVLRNNKKTSMIPFIFLTAYADEGDILKGMALGADDYITKPFSAKALIDNINTRLAKARSGEK